MLPENIISGNNSNPNNKQIVPIEKFNLIQHKIINKHPSKYPKRKINKKNILNSFTYNYNNATPK